MAKRGAARLKRERLLTPEGLFEAFGEIAPGLAGFSRTDIEDEMEWEEVTLHTIVRYFRGCFQEIRATEAQLKDIANLIGISFEVRDDLENAIMTCFVEGGIDRSLRIHLTREAKAYIRKN